MEPLHHQTISMLALDLDGTLLNSNGIISERTLSCLKAVMKREVAVTLCSGRIPAMMRLFVDLLEINGPYVAANGAHVQNRATGEVLISKPIDPDAVVRLIEFYEAHGLEFTLMTNSTLYYSAQYSRLFILEQYNSLSQKLGGPIIKRTILKKAGENYAGEPVLKSLTCPSNADLGRELERFLIGDGSFVCSFSESGLFDITAFGTDKAYGLQAVADYYGVPMAQVCAIGDFDNDIGMLKNAGLGIAMGNASENLLSVADYQTETNDKDGVAAAIARIWNWTHT